MHFYVYMQDIINSLNPHHKDVTVMSVLHWLLLQQAGPNLFQIPIHLPDEVLV